MTQTGMSSQLGCDESGIIYPGIDLANKAVLFSQFRDKTGDKTTTCSCFSHG